VSFVIAGASSLQLGRATFAFDSTFNIENVTDATKQLGFSLGGVATGKKLTIASVQTTSQTLNVPDITATDTLVTLGLAQTISALKTFGAGLTISAGALTIPTGSVTATIGGILSWAAATAITGGGTLALGGFTLTVPETMTAAGRDVVNTFAAANTFSATLTIAGTTASTSTTTGSLVNNGGFGCAGDIFGGGKISLSASGTTSANGITWTDTSIYRSDAGAMTFAPAAATDGRWNFTRSTGENFFILIGSAGYFGTSTATAFAIQTNSASAIIIDATQNSTFYGRLNVNSSTASTSTATGSLVNAGGFGNAGDAFIGGNVSLSTVGKGLYIKEGTNATMGSAVLVGGTVTVSTTKVTAGSRIFLSVDAIGGTLGIVAVSARSAGTSFTVTSSNALDTSTISWLIVEPA
jgi:predicted enzyme related to lactoylglutathione lyase